MLKNKNEKSSNTINRHGLSEFVRAFKTFSARKINILRNSSGSKIWQKGFHDRIIKNDIDLENVRKYIIDNPQKLR